MVVKDVKTQEEFDAAVKEKGVAVVDFYADWCGPCKMIGPYLEVLSDQDEYKDMTFLKVDVDNDELEDCVKKADVTAMPTFCIFRTEQAPDGSVDVVVSQGSDGKAMALIGANRDKLKEFVAKAKEISGQ